MCTGFVFLCLRVARHCCLCWLFFGASPVASPPPRFGVPSAAVPALSVSVQLMTSCGVKSSREVLETTFKKKKETNVYLGRGAQWKALRAFQFCLFVWGFFCCCFVVALFWGFCLLPAYSLKQLKLLTCFSLTTGLVSSLPSSQRGVGCCLDNQVCRYACTSLFTQLVWPELVLLWSCTSYTTHWFTSTNCPNFGTF